MEKKATILSVCAVVLALACGWSCLSGGSDIPEWPEIKNIHKPWMYWWWMGNAVDEENISKQLELFYDAGFGGVHIVPIYGVKGYEDRFLEFLSPHWMRMLDFTVREARRYGMEVDMTSGTGWPFGGPQVDEESAAKKVLIKSFEVKPGQDLPFSLLSADKELGKGAKIQKVIANSAENGYLDLTDKVDIKGWLNWVAPKGRWEVNAVIQSLTGQEVKRAAPGQEGYVVDHFSTNALNRYLQPFDNAFFSFKENSIRGFYCDSYEVNGADWTENFLTEFYNRRGYDLSRYLHALNGKDSDELVARVYCDYRETISDLLLDRFARPWTNWAHSKGCLVRYEAHGGPGNLLDLYAVADIPETESFGPAELAISGLRRDRDYPRSSGTPDVLMYKFASSAAHVTGKNLVSAESCTWLGEHFKVALSQVKAQIDHLFTGGINHIFYHGIPYSPVDEEWPGWQFYASTYFGPFNTFWCDLPETNLYIARCQSLLQSGRPANDILLYFPIYDLWHDREKGLKAFTVHNADAWLSETDFYRIARQLYSKGYTFDYISDRQLLDVSADVNVISSGLLDYKTVIVPHCHMVPVRTLEKLVEIATYGATVVFHESLPTDVPGLMDLDSRRATFLQIVSSIKPVDSDSTGISAAEIGRGKILLGDDVIGLVGRTEVKRESMMDRNLHFVRRRLDDGYVYFVVNFSATPVDGWVTLATKARSAVIYDPLTAKKGSAAVRAAEGGKTQIYLQLDSGHSRIVRTAENEDRMGQTWYYTRSVDDAEFNLQGEWKISFIKGGPIRPPDRVTANLVSWTEFGNEYADFSGTAKYELSFRGVDKVADNWELDLGRVGESARISLNGRLIGTVWCFPYEILLDSQLNDLNHLEILVTNLMANRVAFMDREKIPWKRFYNINFVDINYKSFDASSWLPMPSGLMGPVHIRAINRKNDVIDK